MEWIMVFRKHKKTNRLSVKEYQTSLRKFEKLQQGFYINVWKSVLLIYPTPETYF